MRSFTAKPIVTSVLIASCITLGPAHAIGQTTTQVNQIKYNQLTEDDRGAAASVAIFFGGMAVGWIVDGTIQYATGKAPSEWVAVGLKKVESYIIYQYKHGSKKIVVPPMGAFTCPGVVIDHSGMCRP